MAVIEDLAGESTAWWWSCLFACTLKFAFPFILVRLLTARVVLAMGMDMGKRRAGKGPANARNFSMCLFSTMAST